MDDFIEWLIKIVVGFLITSFLLWIGCSRGSSKMAGNVVGGKAAEIYHDNKDTSSENSNIYIYNETGINFNINLSCNNGQGYDNHQVGINNTLTYHCRDNNYPTIIVSIGNGLTYSCEKGKSYKIYYNSSESKYVLVNNTNVSY